MNIVYILVAVIGIGLIFCLILAATGGKRRGRVKQLFAAVAEQ